MLGRHAGSLLAASLLLAATPAAAQPVLDIRAEFARIAADEALLADMLPLWFGPIPAGHEPLRRAYFIDLLAEPLLADRLERDYPPGPGQDLAAYVASVGPQVTQNLTIEGIALLSSDMQLRTLEHMLEYTAWLRENRPDQCFGHLYGEDDLETLMELGATFEGTLPLDGVAALMEIERSALMAVLSGAPPVNVFTEAQYLAAGQMAEPNLNDARFLGWAPDAADIIAVMDGAAATNPASYCDFVYVYRASVLSLPLPERDWYLQYLFTPEGRSEFGK